MSLQPAHAEHLERTKPTEDEKLEIARNMLRLVADQPGHSGRLRICRIVLGMPVPIHPNDEHLDFEQYIAVDGIALTHTVPIIDSLIDGGLLAQTRGPRPVVVLTLTGLRELDRMSARHTCACKSA